MNENLYEVILFLIDQASKSAKRYSQREMDQRGLDITVDQFVLLKLIAQHNGLSQKELGEKSLRDRASITRTLDLLEKKGLIVREADPNSRRQYHLHLTKSGTTFITTYMPLIESLRSKSLEGFSESEIETFKSYLLRLKGNFEG
ncbi:MAG: MarR family transcriptional regulator [Bacteroidota bacterium]